METDTINLSAARPGKNLAIALFIVGTDTDVGKTVVTAGVAAAAIETGLAVAVMKPVQTGTAGADGDLVTIHRLVPDLTPLPPELACGYAFPLPASPHLAAEAAGETILPERILATLAAARQHPCIDLLLVEGAGGIMVPLQRNYLQWDLLRQANIPLLLVTRAGIGTINHTLLSLNALRICEIRTAGLVVNRMPASPGPVETDNLRYFRETLDVPVITVVPDAPSIKDAVAAMRHDTAVQTWIKTYCRTSRLQF